MLTKNELKEYIEMRFDPNDIIEILDLSTEDLMKYLLDVCHKHQDLFVDEQDIWHDDDV